MVTGIHIYTLILFCHWKSKSWFGKLFTRKSLCICLSISAKWNVIRIFPTLPVSKYSNTFMKKRSVRDRIVAGFTSNYAIRTNVISCLALWVAFPNKERCTPYTFMWSPVSWFVFSVYFGFLPPIKVTTMI